MKTMVVTVTSDGYGMNGALAMTEALGTENGLDKKSALHLRLLSEELLGMLRSIAGEVQANYWAQAEGKAFELHMKSEVQLTGDMRDRFISASSRGKNDAARGFTGRLRVMIAGFLLSAKEALPYAMIDAVSVGSMEDYTGGTLWSMSYYKEEVCRRMANSEEATAAWDELEKSILAKVADDVKVKILGNDVEIIVSKNFA